MDSAEVAWANLMNNEVIVKLLPRSGKPSSIYMHKTRLTPRPTTVHLELDGDPFILAKKPKKYRSIDEK